MDADILKKLYSDRGLGAETAERAVAFAQAFEDWLSTRGQTFSTAGEPEIRNYLEPKRRNAPCTREELLAIGRYCYLIGNYPVYIFILKLYGNEDLYSVLSSRIAELAGQEIRDTVFHGIRLPPMGSPPEVFPAVTRDLVRALAKAVPQDLCARILTGNMHQIPSAAFADAAERFARERDIDRFLKDHHDRAVAVLEEHAKSGVVWYEQIITPAVVEFVRGNQEILSAVREGNTLYATKIPYDPDGYLKERDQVRKRYLACHCPLARESLASGNPDIPAVWCSCSAGFEKLLFDSIFGEPTEVTVLETLFAGNDRCRFAMTIPESVMRSKGIA